VKIKKAIQDSSHQSRAATFTAAEMGFLENGHGAKLISALEKWYLRKVCYLSFFIILIFYT
jgi:hypothetical protein